MDADLDGEILAGLSGVDIDMDQAFGNRDRPLGRGEIAESRSYREHGVGLGHQALYGSLVREVADG